MRNFLLTSSLLVVFSCLAFAQSAPKKLEFVPAEMTDYSGKKIPIERGKLAVSENRSKPGSRTIELAVIRLKSKAEKPGAPIVYLSGGPGGSAIGEATQLAYLGRLFEQMQQTHDVILMDQRGAGRSAPLIWLSPAALPADFFLSEQKATEHARQWSKLAVEHFKSRGIDLMGYNSVESADDLNDLRLALGAEKLNLLGFSYGTHLGLAAIRRHAAHLDSVVLAGTECLDCTDKLPSTFDAQMRKLADLAAQDPNVNGKVPDMFALFQRLLAKLEKEPLTVTVQNQRTKQPVDVKVGKYGLQLLVRLDIGDGNDFPDFPLLFYTLDKGDTSALKKYVEKRYNQLGLGVSGMAIMMDLFSGASPERTARIQKEAATALLGNVMNTPAGLAELWGNPDLGEAYRAPLLANTRTLFISGTLDSNTPPYQAEEVRWGFSNGTHLIVEYAGHEDTLPNPAVQTVILDFFNGKDVSQVRVSLGKPKFKPIP